MRIAIGCDHAGFDLKCVIISLLSEAGYSYEDFGCYDKNSVDYPDIGQAVAEAVAQGRCDRGILLCSTGIGMCIVANKVRGIRAALCHNAFTAQRAREHNDANILCLGGEVVGQGSAREIVAAYLNSSFEGGRHARRLKRVQILEGENAKNTG
jgi:ribose 5-phosphate isomerase B